MLYGVYSCIAVYAVYPDRRAGTRREGCIALAYSKILYGGFSATDHSICELRCGDVNIRMPRLAAGGRCAWWRTQVQLPTFAAIKAFVPFCRLSRNPADIAAAGADSTIDSSDDAPIARGTLCPGHVLVPWAHSPIWSRQHPIFVSLIQIASYKR